jgi:competence protein ComEA
MQQARPLRPGERIDLDRAPLSELNRLPKVGPRLAKAILANRSQAGPFGSLAGLDRVPGIGPGLLQVLEPHAAFSGTPESVPPPNRAQPGSGVVAARLDLNSATMLQLDSLPGVGQTKAAAILRYRQEHGPFTAIEQLEQVEGFGPAAVARLQDRLEVR